ncbi:hypothetical protein MMC29_006207 [Sticta canariensis]|nr:hypothetical protein [Sticta canariensis]
MAPNFAECRIKFLNTSSYDKSFIYDGPTRGIFATNATRDNVTLITVAGCRRLCQTGNEYYAWKDSSATITTWVLPVIGLLLQAPFESNEFWRTFWALARWTGSPVASLSYILWNIKVTSKCALMVDMATMYDEVPDQDSQFAQIRDSFYILSVMNQYTIKQGMPAVAAERLLRIALFSDSLQLTAIEDRTRCLVKRRSQLASLIRRDRKKGVVPVFICLMWFLFSLAISIQAAWGQLGSNAAAHDMALGLLLAWLPILILTSIVDRNPVAANSILMELNSYLDDIRSALLDPGLRNTYIRDTGRTQEDFAWTDALNNEDFFRQAFFTQFAGQGRVRWHYGVAHPILEGIERTFMADWGRNWLKEPERARTLLVLGPDRSAGLTWFDFRMIWQIMSSVCLVCGTVGGAFILSYWTPTVGLGCRSGGYLIFVVVALGTFALELLVWPLMHDGTGLSHRRGQFASEDPITLWGSSLERRLSYDGRNRSRFVGAVRDGLSKMLFWGSRLTLRDCMEVFLLRPFEIGNFLWLIYIVMAQTFGFYQNCDCMASTWGAHGGYIDFEVYQFYIEHGVTYYWGFGVALSCAMMTTAFAFIVTEYCTQSHLSTEDYADAAQGLRRTRCFKKYTYFLGVPGYLIEVGKRVCHKIFGRYVDRGRRSLVWTWKTRHLTIPMIVIEDSSLRGTGGGRSEDGSFLDGGETDGGETDGGETDDGTDASVEIPLRKMQPARRQRIDLRR